MTTLRRNPLCSILVAVAVSGLLAACAPPPMTSASGNSQYETRQLQSSLDRQEQALVRLTRQVEQLEEQVDRQSRDIEQLRQGTPQAPTDYQAYQAPQPTTEARVSVVGESSPTEVYLQAFGDYASGRYMTAINGFESFLQHFPNNSYASNARFWLGDCYFNQQQYPMAIHEFERVLNDYQNAPKSPDALLKIAAAQLQLGEVEKARQTVDTLNRRFPKSTATQKAQELAIP